jgi:MYXO-CTERM domain-containing protein
MIKVSMSWSRLVREVSAGGAFWLLAAGAAGTAQAQLAAGEATDQLVLSNWAGNLPQVTDLTFLSDGRAVVVTKLGKISVLAADGTVIKDVAYTFPSLDTGSEKGVLGVVRDDADNVYIYASTGTTNADKHRIYKGRVGADGTLTLGAMTIEGGGLEGPANHDGGGLEIYKGQLYVSVGDTGFNSTPPTNKYGACLNKPNGKILRLNLDGSVPTDNPLATVAMATSCESETGGTYGMAAPDKRIYAWGFRNPWRFWTDAETGLMWIGDVGEGTEEEVSVGGKGSNHGWPFNEGKVNYPNPLGGLKDCKDMVPPTDCVAPQFSYQHGGPIKEASVTGGLIPPKGCGWGTFEGRYFFGDYNRNVVWTLDVAADRKSAVAGSNKTAIDVPAPVSFRMGPGGAMYIASHSSGIVKKLVPKTVPAGCAVNAGPGGDGGVVADGGGAGGAGGVPGGSGAGGVPGSRTGGSPGADVGAGTGGAGGGGSDGCSCALGAAHRGGGTGAGAFMLALAAVVARRARRRHKNPSPQVDRSRAFP